MSATFTTEYDETFTIAHRDGDYYGDGDDSYTIIEAHDEDGDLVSELYADRTTGQIMQVETIETHRREGIATALVAYATEQGITLFHSPACHRTEDGSDWADQIDLDTIDPAAAFTA